MITTLNTSIKYRSFVTTIHNVENYSILKFLNGDIQHCGDTAGGGEDRACRRSSSDGDSCVREGRQEISSSTDGLSGRLVGGMKHGLELGDCALRLPPRGETSREETLGFDNGHGRYGDGGVV